MTLASATISAPCGTTAALWREVRKSPAATHAIAMIVASVPLLQRDAAIALGVPPEMLDLPWHEQTDRVMAIIARSIASPILISEELSQEDQSAALTCTYGPYVAIAQPLALLAHAFTETADQPGPDRFSRLYRSAASMIAPPVKFTPEFGTALSQAAHDLSIQRLLVRALYCGMPRTYYPATLYGNDALLAEARALPGSMAVGVTGGKPSLAPREIWERIAPEIHQHVEKSASRPSDEDLLLMCIAMSERHRVAFHRILMSVRKYLEFNSGSTNPAQERSVRLLSVFYSWYMDPAG